MPAWTPLKIPNIVGFWRADQGVTVASPTPLVTQWLDQSSSGINITNTAGTGSNFQPSFSATGFNTSFPGVSFTPAAKQTLQTANTSVLASSPSLSFFMLMTINALGPSSSVFLSFLSSAQWFNSPAFSLYDFANGNFGIYSTGHQAFFTSGTPATVLATFTFDGVSSSAFNGAVAGSPTGFASTLGGAGTISLGCPPTNPVGAANFTVAAAGVCSAYTMTAADIAHTIFWANANFGTSIAGGIDGGDGQFLTVGANIATQITLGS